MSAVCDDTGCGCRSRRYGKKYETPDEMKQRYSIFVESLKTIRSHNKKGLSYTLGVNGKLLVILDDIYVLESANNYSY
ncbi:hypothetical protein L2E82_40267 [Cichorium intybus]|uniref:Uncharacterized protein n=1 Tax=Cichorium intybus TaxID=13427 RepID=A0ACB9ALI0_CICIN|nr:hypothetical protein L2E82_40267 [Cichorium intybus]